jgi:hypothetical protein
MSEYKFVSLKKSDKEDKKYMVTFENRKTKRTKTIYFGAAGMEDYTIHKDKARKENYLKRHKGMGEDWSDSGIMTAGYWSRWLLWSKPDFKDALKLVMGKLKKAGYLS